MAARSDTTRVLEHGGHAQRRDATRDRRGRRRGQVRGVQLADDPGAPGGVAAAAPAGAGASPGGAGNAARYCGGVPQPGRLPVRLATAAAAPAADGLDAIVAAQRAGSFTWRLGPVRALDLGKARAAASFSAGPGWHRRFAPPCSPGAWRRPPAPAAPTLAPPWRSRITPARRPRRRVRWGYLFQGSGGDVAVGGLGVQLGGATRMSPTPARAGLGLGVVRAALADPLRRSPAERAPQRQRDRATQPWQRGADDAWRVRSGARRRIARPRRRNKVGEELFGRRRGQGSARRERQSARPRRVAMAGRRRRRATCP